jgi:3-oxoacyl-[acyl-carrier protein] reductase
MKSILVVGISGSLGKTFYDGFKSLKQYEVYGTSTKKENINEKVFHLDILDANSIELFPSKQFDHVIIAAGYEPSSNLQDSNEQHIEKMFRIHAIGPMLFIKRIQAQLSDQSSITLISSPAAWQGSYDPSYAAVKGAVNAMVRTLAKDLAPKTRVNALSPSLIQDSTVFNGMTDDFKQRHVNRTLNKRLLTLPECFDAIQFIIEAKHYTGQILHLNGGMIYG